MVSADSSKEEALKAEQELKRIQALVESIDGQGFTVKVKIGDEGQLFESITALKIQEALKKEGFEVDKSQIELEEPIKELGEFPVKLKFDHKLEAEITIIIEEEK